jgi:hypothetical protein
MRRRRRRRRGRRRRRRIVMVGSLRSVVVVIGAGSSLYLVCEIQILFYPGSRSLHTTISVGL